MKVSTYLKQLKLKIKWQILVYPLKFDVQYATLHSLKCKTKQNFVWNLQILLKISIH